jgi:hypothetical protein
MISGVAAGFVKSVAEGKYGEGPKKVYWFLAGKKTWIAIGIAALAGVGQVAVNVLSGCVPECGSAESVAQLQGLLNHVPAIVGFLVAVGLFDAAVRIEPPKKG